MKLLFKQRFLSWLDSFDVYNENGDTVYTVEGQFSFGKRLKVFDAADNFLGEIKQELFTFLPRFEIYIGDELAGEITKEFSFFSENFNIDYLGWHIDGDAFGWDYTVSDSAGNEVAKISKELFNLTDTYCIDVKNITDTLHVLMLVLAIDAEKASK